MYLIYDNDKIIIRMATDGDEIPIFHLTKEMKDHFTKTRDLLDSILETFEILEDKDLVNRVQLAEQELLEGKKATLESLKKELSVDEI